VLEQVRQSQADPIIVVTGHQADHVRDALEGCDVTFAQNDDFANGLSTSLRRGLEVLPETVSGALICLGDMPNLQAGQIDALIAAFQKHRGEKICVPVFKGRAIRCCGRNLFFQRCKRYAVMRAPRNSSAKIAIT
jgi:molybdenum cofactor cytidylyltransferase